MTILFAISENWQNYRIEFAAVMWEHKLKPEPQYYWWSLTGLNAERIDIQQLQELNFTPVCSEQ